MDPLYLTGYVPAEKKFWRCVQSGEPPDLISAIGDKSAHPGAHSACPNDRLLIPLYGLRGHARPPVHEHLGSRASFASNRLDHRTGAPNCTHAVSKTNSRMVS